MFRYLTVAYLSKKLRMTKIIFFGCPTLDTKTKNPAVYNSTQNPFSPNVPGWSSSEKLYANNAINQQLTENGTLNIRQRASLIPADAKEPRLSDQNSYS
jgi:hypothetical protein